MKFSMLLADQSAMLPRCRFLMAYTKPQLWECRSLQGIVADSGYFFSMIMSWPTDSETRKAWNTQKRDKEIDVREFFTAWWNVDLHEAIIVWVDLSTQTVFVQRRTNHLLRWVVESGHQAHEWDVWVDRFAVNFYVARFWKENLWTYSKTERCYIQWTRMNGKRNKHEQKLIGTGKK